MTTIDFNQLMSDAGDGFQPIPDGPYNVEVSKTEATMSSTNKPMIRVTLKIIDGPHAGRLLFEQFVITAGNPTALGFFFEHMASFGLDKTYFASNPPLETVAGQLMGRSAMVSVGTKAYKGVDRNEVTAYRPISLGGGTPAPAPVAGVPGPGAPTAPPAAAPIPQAPAPPAAPAPTPAQVPQPPAPAPAAPVTPPAQAPQAAPVAPQSPPAAEAAPAAAVPPLPAGVVPPAAPAAPPSAAETASVTPPPAPAQPEAPAQPQAPATPPAPPAAYSPNDEEAF